jgi:ABC-type multidrug transport system ATPase subunit
VIHARGLVQTFSTKQGRKKTEVRAVDGVDLDVTEGEVVGFLGPNGAGKTTTLRMLVTLLTPTAGHRDRCGLRRRPRLTRGAPADRVRVAGGRRLQRSPGRR